MLDDACCDAYKRVVSLLNGIAVEFDAVALPPDDDAVLDGCANIGWFLSLSELLKSSFKLEKKNILKNKIKSSFFDFIWYISRLAVCGFF